LSVKLFGSKARGDSHRNSDIDLIIVLKTSSESNKDKVFDVVMKILKEYETYLSVHIYSDKEHKRLNSIPTVFMQMIQRDAITI